MNQLIQDNAICWVGLIFIGRSQGKTALNTTMAHPRETKIERLELQLIVQNTMENLSLERMIASLVVLEIRTRQITEY